MFDAHIQYYAYNNTEGDEFAVGYLGNKEDWIERINRWGRNNGTRSDFTVDDWEDLDAEALNGCELAEVEPNDGGYLVTWATKKHVYVVQMAKNGECSWVENPNDITTVPRWTNRMKTMLRETQKA